MIFSPMQRAANRSAIFASLLVLGLLTTFGWALRSWHHSNLLADHRRQIASQMTPYARTLGESITRQFVLLKGLRAFVEAHASVPTFGEEFELFAAGLVTGSDVTRSLAVAPGGIQRYIYSQSGGEDLLGQNLIQDSPANVRADVKRAIESREITLSAPFELRPGGFGLIARLSIYLKGHFWGLVSITLDLAPIFEDAGLYGDTGGLGLALRDRSGRILLGDSNVFNSEPVLYPVRLPEGSWELAAVPSRGWRAPVRQRLVILDITLLIIVLLLTCVTYLLVDRQSRLRRLVEERTQEVTRVNAELARDLAERKRIEDELRKTHDELETRVRQRTADLEKAVAALAAEIEERKTTEQERNLLLTITHAVADAEDVHAALGIALRKICETTGWDFGEAWTPNPDGSALELSPAWCGTGELLERFRKSTTKFRPKTGSGLIVRVWNSKKPEWIPDASVAPLSYRAEIAHEAGLKATLGVPIVANDQVQAVLVFFMSASREEDRRQVEIVLAVAAQLGSLIQRKRAEEALRESERRFQAIFDQAYQFVGLLSPDGTLLEANQTALEFIGCNRGEVVGRPFWETSWWDISPEVQKKLKNSIAEAAMGHFVRFETQHRRRDGFVSTFDFSLKPVFDDHGRVVLIIPEGRNITSRKQAEEDLRMARDELETRVQERTRELAKSNEDLRAEIAQRQRLQEQLIENGRLAAIGATTAKIAHEIGNPLNAMFLTAQRLERQLARPERDDEAAQLILRRLTDEIRRLNYLVGEFRALAHRETYNFQPIALPVIANEILAIETENYVDKGIRVEQDFPGHLPLIRGDRDKLKQALWNLCKNAVEAMPQGGTLTLRACESGSDIVLEIRDTGVGIPHGFDIFEPFTTSKSSGSGLGLVIVRQVIAAHGGSINCVSKPGKGTTFRLMLPQADLRCATN